VIRSVLLEQRGYASACITVKDSLGHTPPRIARPAETACRRCHGSERL